MAQTEELAIDDYEIIRILSDDQIFCDKWRIFCQILGFRHAIMVSPQPDNSTTDIILNIMRHWRNTSPSTNLHILSQKLKELGCNKSAEEVEGLCKK